MRFVSLPALVVLSALAGSMGCQSREEPTPVDESTPSLKAPVAPPALEQEDPAKSLTIDASHPEERVLRFKPVAERTYLFELTQKASRLGQEPPVVNEVVQTMTLSRKLVEPVKDGWLEEVRFRDLKLVPREAEKDRIAPTILGRTMDLLSRMTVRLETDFLGNVKSVEVKGADGPNDMLASMLEQLMRDASFPLPEQPVKPGDQWKVHRTASFKRAKTDNDVTYDLVGEYLGQVTVEGLCQPCDVLRLQGPFELTGELKSAQMKGQTRGVGQTRVVLLFNGQDGSVAQSFVQTVMEQQFNVRKDGQQLTLVERQEMSLKQTLQPAAAAEDPEKNKENQ